MKLYEYEAKDIFRKNNIPVSDGVVVESADDGLGFFNAHKPVVLKSQVLSGGRGKAGGIRFASTEDEYLASLDALLSLTIKDLPVRTVLVERKLDIKNELYLGYSILRSEAKIAFMISKEGGVEIEELARERPEAIVKHSIDILDGIGEPQMSDLVGGLGLSGDLADQIAQIARALYTVFTDYECEVAEINPLVITAQDEVVAADARIAIYDEAVAKHPEYQKEEDTYTPLEKDARRQNLGYVEMDGNIGVIGNGAGLNMANLDILTYYHCEPANFLEVSGRTYHKAKEAIEIVLSKPGVKAIFGNFFGCISRCDVIALGLAEAFKSGAINVPMVVAMRGTGAEAGIATLREAGLAEVYEDDVEAGKRMADILKES